MAGPCNSGSLCSALAHAVRSRRDTAWAKSRAADAPCRQQRQATLPTLRTVPRSALPHQRKPDEAERADDHPPPGEQVEAVSGHIVEKALHHEPPGDE